MLPNTNRNESRSTKLLQIIQKYNLPRLNNFDVKKNWEIRTDKDGVEYVE